jgi:glycerophosphoryl diester phosphodiesterase
MCQAGGISRCANAFILLEMYQNPDPRPHRRVGFEKPLSKIGPQSFAWLAVKIVKSCGERLEMLIIAHRGASGEFPENTLPAFSAAIAAGAQMCELDVQLTRDAAAVVIHDENVDRTTDATGPVAAMNLAQIRLMDAGVKFGAAFIGTRIPTLEDVMTLVKGRCALNVELKSPGVEREVCRLWRAHGDINDTIVSSFDWDALASARRLEPDLRLGVLADRNLDAMLQAASRLRAVSVNPRFNLVTPALVEKAHRAGFKVLVWTVDRVDELKRMVALGVDGIMTNYPARLAAILGCAV